MRATERDDEQHEAPSQRAVAPASRTKRHVSPSAGLGFRTNAAGAGLAGGGATADEISPRKFHGKEFEESLLLDGCAMVAA